LKGVTVTFVGDSEGANDAVGRALASALGYVPLSTPDLVEKITGQTRAEIVESDGEGGLVIAENAVFEQLSTQLRCVISTSGGGKGASARGACWDYLFGHFVIWLDDVDAAAAAAADPAAAPQREAYEFADAHLVMRRSGSRRRWSPRSASCSRGTSSWRGRRRFTTRWGVAETGPRCSRRGGTARRRGWWTRRRGNRTATRRREVGSTVVDLASCDEVVIF
jgi:shikimate kinase